MQAVLLTIHLIACIALIIAIMLQRSEGGALGMGGGGTGGLISGRGAAGMLVRVTMVLAVIFFITSISMTYLNNQAAHAPSVLDGPATTPSPFGSPSAPPATTTPDPLGGGAATAPATPAPAAPATTPDPLAPATTAPTAPAPTPENGGSPN